MFSIFFSNEIPIYRWITFARIFLVLCHCYLPSEKLTFVTLGSLRGCHFKTTLRERAFLFLSFFVKTCSAQVTHVSTEVCFKARLAVPLTMRFCHMDMCQQTSPPLKRLSLFDIYFPNQDAMARRSEQPSRPTRSRFLRPRYWLKRTETPNHHIYFIFVNSTSYLGNEGLL